MNDEKFNNLAIEDLRAFLTGRQGGHRFV